jgi:hypothetical protein
MAQRGGTSVQCMWWLYTMIMALYRWHPSNDISGVCEYIYICICIFLYYMSHKWGISHGYHWSWIQTRRGNLTVSIYVSLVQSELAQGFFLSGHWKYWICQNIQKRMVYLCLKFKINLNISSSFHFKRFQNVQQYTL